MSGSPSVLSLPYLAINGILQYLDLRSLKKLRLVCKETKEWVEESKYLQEFKVRLSTTARLKDLITSTVPWDNFWVIIYFSHKSESLFQDFVENFAPHAKHLELKHLFRPEILLSNLNPNIQRLTFENLESVPLDLHSTSGFQLSFSNLRELRIDEIVAKEDIFLVPKNGIFLFDLLLQSCSRLTFLKLPTVNASLDENSNAPLLDKLVLEPLLNYLKRFKNSSLIIDLSGIPRQNFPMTSEGLFKLTHICSKTGVKLENVPIRALPQPNRVTINEMKMLDKSIISVKALDIGTEYTYIPPTSQVHVTIQSYDPRKHDSLVFSGPLHNLHFYNNQYFPIGETLAQELFQVTRPTVQEFKYFGCVDRRNAPEHDSFALQMSESFPNLKKLHLVFWGCDKDCNVLLSRLPHLTHLCLIGCVNLTDQGFIGSANENPLILQLKNLENLEMSRTNITDSIFQNAFRYMNLKTFRCILPKFTKVTFRDGISSLATIENGFKDFIETFEISVPKNCSESDIESLLDRFKNLQSFKICNV